MPVKSDTTSSQKTFHGHIEQIGNMFCDQGANVYISGDLLDLLYYILGDQLSIPF